jgi:hypothetical protein
LMIKFSITCCSWTRSPPLRGEGTAMRIALATRSDSLTQ